MQDIVRIAVTGTLLLAVAGCGQSPAPEKSVSSNTAKLSVSAPSAEGEKLLLKESPVEPQDVIAAREAVADGDDVVVEGRIGGSVDPWFEGRAAFHIVDRSLVPCNERPGDGCTTPWDYCCDTDRLKASKATVKFVDAQGNTLPTDARQLLGLKELQTVVVQGTAQRDEAGNLTVLATGLYVKPAVAPSATSENTP